MRDDDDCRITGGMNDWQGKLKYSEKACPTAALSATDPTLLVFKTFLTLWNGSSAVRTTKKISL
jgi:hypothetical protein